MNKILTFECGPLATNCYLVGDDTSKLAFVVDAPKDSCVSVLSALADRGWTLTDILLTHTHWDHIADCHELQVSTGARVVVHIDDVYRLTDTMTHLIWPPPFIIPDVHEFEAINGSSGSLSILRRTATIDWVHTPGHTEGSICLLDRPRQVAYVGDTLFAGSIGRADLPGGDLETLCASIKQELFCLPDQVLVYPGHGPTTTIGDEKMFNPFVGLQAS